MAVEIISEDDNFQVIMQKCRKYQAWGFGAIYLVDPSDRSVMQWKAEALTLCTELASIDIQQIWNELDKQHTS